MRKNKIEEEREREREKERESKSKICNVRERNKKRGGER